jgi:hypothetical protein
MRLDHNQFGNFRHATEHDGSRSGPCEWRWAPSIDKKGKLSRYERPIPHHLGDTGLKLLATARRRKVNQKPPEISRIVCIGRPMRILPIPSRGVKRRDGTTFTKRTSPVVPDSSMRHRRLRIVRMTSKPLIVADAVGSVLNPRVGFISRVSAP